MSVFLTQPEPDAFFGSSSWVVGGSCFLFEGLLLPSGFVSSSGSRLSCWWVSLCHADLRNPSFLWSEALFGCDDEDGEEDDEEEEDGDFVCIPLLLSKVSKSIRVGKVGRKEECPLLILSDIHNPLRGLVAHLIGQHLQDCPLICRKVFWHPNLEFYA